MTRWSISKSGEWRTGTERARQNRLLGSVLRDRVGLHEQPSRVRHPLATGVGALTRGRCKRTRAKLGPVRWSRAQRKESTNHRAVKPLSATRMHLHHCGDRLYAPGGTTTGESG